MFSGKVQILVFEIKSAYQFFSTGYFLERMFYLQSDNMVKKDIEIQPGFEPGSSEF